MKNFITLHIVNDIPWSNLNRDDSGTPKRTILGGVERGLLSSQSIKRAVRKDYEERALKQKGTAFYNDSYRSRNLPELVVERALELTSNPDVNKKKLLTAANKIIGSLTGSKADAKATITWLSFEEIETLAQVLAETTEDALKDVDVDFVVKGRTGSLAIAAFGRMFANATELQTDAAIAVSPAISTHANLIETDYFITADDYLLYDEKSGGAGAAHLGVALYTSGIFYRTITIDIRELRKGWTGITSEHAAEQLEVFLRSLIYSLPTGKKNHTAPYAEPCLIIVEQQSYREAYSISSPAEADERGFITDTLKNLRRQYDLARQINPENYGISLVSGVEAGTFNGENPLTIADIITQTIEWVLPSDEELAELTVAPDEAPTSDEVVEPVSHVTEESESEASTGTVTDEPENYGVRPEDRDERGEINTLPPVTSIPVNWGNPTPSSPSSPVPAPPQRIEAPNNSQQSPEDEGSGQNYAF